MNNFELFGTNRASCHNSSRRGRRHKVATVNSVIDSFRSENSVSIEDSVDAYLDFVEPKLKKLLTKAVQQQVAKKVASAAESSAKRKKASEAAASHQKKHRKLVTGLSRQSSDPSLDLSPKVPSTRTPTSPDDAAEAGTSTTDQEGNAGATSSSSSSNKYTADWYNSNLGKSVRIYSKRDRRTMQGSIAEYNATPPEAGKCCLIKYDSGRREWLDLSEAVYEFV